MFFIRHGESEFNAVFSGTGRDPGVVDAGLTERGRAQAKSAAEILKSRNITRIISSPYARALETAAIIGGVLGIKNFGTTPLLGERALYSCDVGTCKADLTKKWTAHDFSTLEAETWWPKTGETQESIQRRVNAFSALESDLEKNNSTLAVSHWYFIYTLTGLDLDNAEIVWRDDKGRYHRQ